MSEAMAVYLAVRVWSGCLAFVAGVWVVWYVVASLHDLREMGNQYRLGRWYAARQRRRAAITARHRYLDSSHYWDDIARLEGHIAALDRQLSEENDEDV